MEASSSQPVPERVRTAQEENVSVVRQRVLPSHSVSEPAGGLAASAPSSVGVEVTLTPSRFDSLKRGNVDPALLMNPMPARVLSADLEQSGIVSEERIAKLRARWGIPVQDQLVRVLPCVYKKPRPSHGKMYIFPNHLIFVSHSHHTNVCILFSEVQQMLRKRHRIHLVTANKTHRLRGAITQNSTTYGILLAVWQRALGDQSIDLESITATDKRVQKAIKKAERRASVDSTPSIYTDSNVTSEQHSDSEHDDESDSEDDADVTLESHSVNETPQWKIPLSPIEAPPTGFSASLNPPSDTQNANKVEAFLPANLERCWNLLYTASSHVVIQTMTKQNLSGTSIGEWVPDESEAGVYTRHVTYTKPMQSTFVKGDCQVEQNQRMIYLTQPAKKVLMFQETKMQGVPYSDSFVVHAVYELTEVEEQRTKITNNVWVHWTKAPPLLLRGKIERGSVTGAEESFKGLLSEAEAALLADAQATRTTVSPAAGRLAKAAASPKVKKKTDAPSAPTSAPTSGASVPSGGGVSTPTVVLASAPQLATAGPVPNPNAMQIDPKFVYAVLGILVLSIIANVFLAALR